MQEKKGKIKPPKKALVEFKETTIGKKRFFVTKYKGVWLIPTRHSPIPKKKNKYLIFLPTKESYPEFMDGKSVYYVKIIKSEEKNGIEIFRNTYIPHFLLRKFNKNKATILFNGPGERFGSYFVLVCVKNKNEEGIAKRFLKKNLLVEEKVENGRVFADRIIEINVSNLQELSQIETILSCDLPKLLSET